MNPLRLLLVISFLTTGCSMQTGIEPTEQIIQESTDRDFGFSGTWYRELSPAEKEFGTEPYRMEISQNNHYNGNLTLGDDPGRGSISFEFRTHEISPDSSFAIVEIIWKNKPGADFHRLAIAVVENDRLGIWMIDGRKIGDLLYKDGATAVIEHFPYHSTVRCDQKKLLDCISKNLDNIRGDLWVFHRTEE